MMRRILFVDDEPLVLEGLEDLLYKHSAKWDMVFVPDGEAALRELARAPFDVVVSDMRMPGIDGATLLGRVKEDSPRIVRIVLSGFAEPEAALRAVPVAHQFLAKPTSAEALENVIERACNLQALIGDEVVRNVVGGLQRLPSLPRLYAALTRVLSDETSNARDVVRVIEGDAAMCAKLLQLVNSAFFGLGRRLSSVESAVSYLGYNMIKQLVLALEVFQPWGPSEGRLSIDALQTHSLFVSRLASRMHGGDKRRAEDAFMAGLLHDIGKLVLALGLPGHLEAALETSRRERRPLHEVEQELYGVTHAEIGAYLLGLWGLPSAVVEAVANHHAPGRVPQRGVDALASVYVANVLENELSMRDGLNDDAHAPLDSSYLSSIGAADRLADWTALAETQWNASDAPRSGRTRGGDP